MGREFKSVDEAFLVLADMHNPDWGSAFSFLAAHPETAQVMLETFQATLEEMGVEPTGTDPDSGEPTYTVEDVARTLGVPVSELTGPEGH